MKSLQATLLTLAILTASGPISAQTADPCGCDSALRDGIFSYERSERISPPRSTSRGSSQRCPMIEFKKAASGDLAVGYKKIFNLDASSSMEEFQKQQQQVKSRQVDWKQQASAADLLEKFGDRDVLNTWGRCKSQCTAQGPQLWYTLRDEPTLEVRLRYIPRPGIPELTITSSHRTRTSDEST